MVWMDDEIFGPNDYCCLYDYRDEFACGGERLFTHSDKSTSIQVELLNLKVWLTWRAIALAKTLRCPQCQNQNLVESNSPITTFYRKDLRLVVFVVKAGRYSNWNLYHYSGRFGEFVLYRSKPSLSTANLYFVVDTEPISVIYIFISKECWKLL